MKTNIKMKPTECVIQESRSGFYPMAGFGSGNIRSMFFVLFSTREAVSNSDTGQRQT